MEPRPETIGSKIEMAQFVFSLIGMAVGVIIFTYSTFVTKEEMATKDRADEKAVLIMREDIREIKNDLKEILKNSRR